MMTKKKSNKQGSRIDPDTLELDIPTEAAPTETAPIEEIDLPSMSAALENDLPSFDDQQMPTEHVVLDLSAPETVENRVPTTPKAATPDRFPPPPLPRRKPFSETTRGPNLNSLFDSSESNIAIEQAPSSSTNPTGPGLPTAPLTETDPGSKQLETGGSTGMDPLDISDFGTNWTSKRKKRTTEPRIETVSTPPPMASATKVVSHRFSRTFTIRDIIMLLLVLVLALGVFVGWHIFKDYQRERESSRTRQLQNLIEQGKDRVIQEAEKPKESDIH